MRAFSLLPQSCRRRSSSEARVFACALAAQKNGRRLLQIVRSDLAMTSSEHRVISRARKQARDWIRSQSVAKPPKKRPFHKTRTEARSTWAERRGLRGGGVFVVKDNKKTRSASRYTLFSNGYIVKTSWDPGAQTYATEIKRSARSRPHTEVEARKAARARAHHDNAVRRVVR